MIIVFMQPDIVVILLYSSIVKYTGRNFKFKPEKHVKGGVFRKNNELRGCHLPDTIFYIEP